MLNVLQHTLVNNSNFILKPSTCSWHHKIWHCVVFLLEKLKDKKRAKKKLKMKNKKGGGMENKEIVFERAKQID